MTKRILAYTVTAIALSTLAAGPAHAYENGPAFSLTFYSDASHTTAVGFARPECDPGPHARLQWGYSTQYEEVNWVGECIDGQHYYF